MSFGNLTEDSSIQAERDVVGGDFGPLDSGVYENMKITMAYTITSKAGAMGIVLHFVNPVTQKEFRSTLYVTSKTAKGGNNWYMTKNGEKRYLQGYETFAAISKLSANLAPDALSTEEKTVSLWSYEEKKEVPTQVDVIMPLLGKSVTLGIHLQLQDKSINVNGPGEEPNYKPTGETRKVNEIHKVFRAGDNCTTTEALAGETVGAYVDTWRSKHDGQVIDRRSDETKHENRELDARPAANSTGNVAFEGAAASGDSKPAAPIFGGV